MQDEGMVSVEIANYYRVSGYCSPNIKIDSFYTFINNLEKLIISIRNEQNNIIIAGDIYIKPQTTLKTTAWDGDKILSCSINFFRFIRK